MDQAPVGWWQLAVLHYVVGRIASNRLITSRALSRANAARVITAASCDGKVERKCADDVLRQSKRKLGELLRYVSRWLYDVIC